MASLALSFSLSSPAPALLSSSPLTSAIILTTHRIRSLQAKQYIRQRCFTVQMSKMIDREAINHPEDFRPSGNFSPCMWGDTFANYTLDTELWEKYSQDVAQLKEQVRSTLIAEERNVSEKIILIDILERLGVAYHFQDEIEQMLQELFDNYDYNEDYDLYNVALHFRIFRQHGHNMSSDIFKKYRGSDGKLLETLESDVTGMLSLYEAANLAIQGEGILEEALVFTKTRLRTMLPKLTSHLAEEVKRSLYECLHRRMPIIEARNYIETYQSNPLRNETLLYFAKINFNLVQMLYRQEASTVTKWWNDYGGKLPHVRDRPAEVYLWSLGMYFEPQYTDTRITYAKFALLHMLLDDTYDSYGTVDELKLLTDALEMWDANVINMVPDKLKIVYKSILQFFEELDHQFMGKGIHRALSCEKQNVQDIARCGYRETKWWFKKDEITSFDEYLANGVKFCTCAISPITFSMRESDIHEEAFDWLQSNPKIVISSAIIWRLIDDIKTYEIEKARGQVSTGIDFYINQHGVSKEETVKKLNHMIEKAWKDLNEEYLKSTPILKPLMNAVINSARVMYLYHCSDPFTNPEISTKDLIVSVLVKPIPLA